MAQIGSMLPFFTDFMSLIGAIGFTPMDFVLPQFLWIVAYKPTGFKCAPQHFSGHHLIEAICVLCLGCNDHQSLMVDMSTFEEAS